MHGMASAAVLVAAFAAVASAAGYVAVKLYAAGSGGKPGGRRVPGEQGEPPDGTGPGAGPVSRAGGPPPGGIRAGDQ